ncbi:MAG: hypothetical protein CM15mV133_260 [uncultured marine virus]|nr:MAG: hypothetical protein CM15mV133_260 [uncultured marine virus]
MKLIKSSFGNITTSSAGDHSIPVTARMPGATSLPTATVSPAMVVARMKRLLDQQQVDSQGRWLVIDPVSWKYFPMKIHVYEWRLRDSGGLRNGLGNQQLSWLPFVRVIKPTCCGTGPGTSGTANQNSNFGVIVAGHDSAVATAEQINKTETYRAPTALLTLFVVCIYTAERFFVQKQSLLLNTTQRKGGLRYGYF